jgi:hypothetical protein
LKENELE